MKIKCRPNDHDKKWAMRDRSIRLWVKAPPFNANPRGIVDDFPHFGGVLALDHPIVYALFRGLSRLARNLNVLFGQVFDGQRNLRRCAWRCGRGT